MGIKMRFSSGYFIAILLVAFFGLQGCSSDKKKPLPGARVEVMQFEGSTQADKDAEKTPVTLAEEKANSAWPQKGGNAQHLPQNLALNNGTLKKIWSTSIGSGSKDDRKLISQPVAAEGHVFAADTKGNLGAYNVTDGKKIWSKNILAKHENAATVSAGLAYNDGVLYVSDGVRNLMALNAADGHQLWSHAFDQPIHASPTVHSGRVYIISLDDETFALDAKTGNVLWHHQGVQEAADLLGAPSPAVEGSVVITAYNSGDIVALRSETGQEAWTDNLTGVSEYQSRTVTQLAGFCGSPVLDGDVTIAGNSANRIVAEHVPSGDRVWQKEFGVMDTPWVSGNMVFVLTSQSELIALVKENGQAKWVTSVPRFEKPGDKEDPVFWSGPVLAGGRLLIAGSNKHLMEFDPATGKLVRDSELPDPVMVTPIIVQKTLVVLTDEGDLVAYK
jgi:outer membrane protein assembly factor BamB